MASRRRTNPPRKPGRPRGSRTLYGKARRFDPRWVRAYADAVARGVRDARLEAGISVSELASATGLNSSSIHKIERGEMRATWWLTIIKLAVAIGVSPREVMP